MLDDLHGLVLADYGLGVVVAEAVVEATEVVNSVEVIKVIQLKGDMSMFLLDAFYLHGPDQIHPSC